ncbi:hypothetical protein HUU39_11325 [candidate division KSB1 bacterium]|nr:hypothetical protein [bacterium]NUM65849.1 hypothetical protein [candidate division KSB1 bacterium]
MTIDPRENKWFGWIEVGQKTLQLILGIIQLVPFISAVVAILVAYVSGVNQWAIIALGVAIISFGVAFLMRNRMQERMQTFVNPTLWIDRDEVSVAVYPDRRVVKRRYEFKALKRTERYRFKFRWSGSEHVKVTLEATDDALIKITGPKVQKSWHRYEVRFKETLKAGEKKTVLLSYELPDRGGESEPYHCVSYGHVAGCSALLFRLMFPQNEAMRDVYLIHYDADWVVQKGLPIGIDPDDNEYRAEIKPEPGMRYSLEWQER